MIAEILTCTQQLISFALNQLVSTFGHDTEMAALWCMRVSPTLVYSEPLGTIIQKLMLVEERSTSKLVISRRIDQNWVDVGNHLCNSYQTQRYFNKAIKISQDIINVTAVARRVYLIFVYYVIGLIAESYLARERYDGAKSYANRANGRHEQTFGPDPKDSSISAWRRRNLTAMANAAYLDEFELAEVI